MGFRENQEAKWSCHREVGEGKGGRGVGFSAPRPTKRTRKRENLGRTIYTFVQSLAGASPHHQTMPNPNTYFNHTKSLCTP